MTNYETRSGSHWLRRDDVIKRFPYLGFVGKHMTCALQCQLIEGVHGPGSRFFLSWIGVHLNAASFFRCTVQYVPNCCAGKPLLPLLWLFMDFNSKVKLVPFV